MLRATNARRGVAGGPRWAGALALLAIAAWAPSQARAQAAPPVASHGFRTLGLTAEEASGLDAAARLGLRRRGAIVAPTTSEPIAASCRDDRRCHCAAARHEGASLALYGNISRLGDFYNFELTLIDAQTCEVVAATFVSESLTAEVVGQRLRALVAGVATPPEEISRTAGKAEAAVDDLPVAVTVVPRARLRDLGMVEFEDVLAQVPGFEVIETNFGSHVLHLGLPTTMLYMIDGVPLADAQHGIRFLGRDLRLRLGHFDRVELVRGPASVLWGANALLGVVNLTTAPPTGEALVVETAARLTTPRSAELYASLGQRRGALAYQLSGTLLRQRGSPEPVDDSLAGSFGLPEAHWGNAGFTSPAPDLYGDLVARFTAWNQLTLGLTYVDHTTRWEISPFGSLLDPDHPGVWRDRLRIYHAGWRRTLAPGLTLDLSGHRLERIRTEDFVFHPADPAALPGGLHSVQGHPSEPRVNQAAELRLTQVGVLGAASSRLLTGASVLHQRVPDSLATITSLDADIAAPAVSFPSKRFLTGAGFVHETLALGGVALMAGLRYELRDPLPSGVTREVGLSAGSGAVSGKLLWSEGFRPPEAVQLFSTVGTQGNPELEPERSRAATAELAIAPNAALRTRLGASYTQLDNLVVLDAEAADPGFAYKPINRGTIDVRFAYAEAEVQLGARATARLNATVKDVARSEPTGRLPIAPWTAAGSVVVWPSRTLRVFGHGSLLGPRTVQAYQPSAAPAPLAVVERRLPVDLHWTVGLGLTELWQGAALDVLATNPLRYVHQSPIIVDGRPSGLIERRVDAELTVQLRWTR